MSEVNLLFVNMDNNEWSPELSLGESMLNHSILPTIDLGALFEDEYDLEAKFLLDDSSTKSSSSNSPREDKFSELESLNASQEPRHPSPMKICTPVTLFGGKQIRISTVNGWKFMVHEIITRKVMIVTLFNDDEELMGKRRNIGKRKPQQEQDVENEESQSEPIIKKRLLTTPLSQIGNLSTDLDGVQSECNSDEATAGLLKVLAKMNGEPEEPEEKQNSTQSAKGPTKNVAGHVDYKRCTIRSQCQTEPRRQRMQVFNNININGDEDEIAGYFCYVDYVRNTVMNVKSQGTLWGDMLKYKVLQNDEILSSVIDVLPKTEDEVIQLCYLLRRAFFCFLRRVALAYYFVYPHVSKQPEFQTEILLQLWYSLSVEDKEIIYYGKSSFNYEILTIMSRYPPGVLENKILQNMFPNGENNPRPGVSFEEFFYDELSEATARKEEVERRRQAEDMEALENSPYFLQPGAC